MPGHDVNTRMTDFKYEIARLTKRSETHPLTRNAWDETAKIATTIVICSIELGVSCV